MSVVDRLAPGVRLGRFECLFPLARGGMAAVWVARIVGARGFQKPVAIKTMLPAYFDDPKYQAMFLDEARLASQLHHPNVVEVLELGEEQGALFLAMELVDGVSLHQLSTAPPGLPLPVDAVVTIGLDLCAALARAHEATDEHGRPQPVVHRDVSPANVMLTREGVAKLGDFGIAKVVGAQGRTEAGLVKGKPAYMAPEQAVGRAVDVRADQFSVAVVLYELSTGEHPFRGDTAVETAHRLMTGTFAAPSAIVGSSYPPALERAILRALAKDPSDRFATVAELGRALAQAGDGQSGRSTIAALLRERVGRELDERRRQLAQALNRTPGDDAPARQTLPRAAEATATATAAAAPVRRGRGRWWALAGIVALAGGAAALLGREPKAVAPAPAAPRPIETPRPVAPIAKPPAAPEPPAAVAAPASRPKRRRAPSKRAPAPAVHPAPSSLPPIRDPGF